MIGLAVVGCGRMASDLARKAVEMERARIVAIHDIDPQALRERSAEFGAEPVASIQELALREDVNAYLVGSPPLVHYENVLALAPHGKPIYSEKPLSTTVARCDAMIAACREHGVKLFVGQVLRLFPAFWKSYEVVASGKLGEPRLCSITRAGRGTLFSEGWRLHFANTGGLLLEVNSHELDYLLFLMGEAESVYAQSLNLNHWGDHDDAYSLQIRFKNGGIGMLHSSNSSPLGEYRVHLQCTQGNLLHTGFGGELKYRAFEDTETTVVEVAHYDPYKRELESFFDWIEKDTPPLFTGETGRANVAVAEAAYRSVASGKPEFI